MVIGNNYERRTIMEYNKDKGNQNNNSLIQTLCKIAVTISITISVPITINFFIGKNTPSSPDNQISTAYATQEPTKQPVEEPTQIPADPPTLQPTEEPTQIPAESSVPNDNNLTTGTAKPISDSNVIINYVIKPEPTQIPETETHEETNEIKDNEESVNKDDANRGASIINNSNNSSEETNTNFNLDVYKTGQLILFTDTDPGIYDQNEFTIKKTLKAMQNTDTTESTYPPSDASENENINANDENCNNENNTPEQNESDTDNITDLNNNSDTNEPEMQETEYETPEITYNISDICNYTNNITSSAITYINIEPGQYEFTFTDCEINVNFCFIPDIASLYSEYWQDNNIVTSDESYDQENDNMYEENNNEINNNNI